ncbi:MAG TPA: hypothetical protein VFE32_09390 [Puia sp.]|jgi:hypothetical protein|nr:hypothetical protein [Puia sp.]
MTTSNIQPDDYISFSGLRSFITGAIRFFFKCCRFAAGAARDHVWPLVMGIVLGGLAGWLYHALFGQRYKVSMIVEYRVLDKPVYRDVVSDINRMIQSGSRRQVAVQLGIPFRLVEKVNKLGTTDLNGKPLTDDPVGGSSIFLIVGELRSPEGADSLGDALISYINGLPYLESEIAEQMKIRQDQLVFIRQELANIDSLRKDNLRDPASVYHQSYSLDSLRAAIRKYLIHGNGALSQITKFRASDEPQSAPAAFVVIVLAVGGFLIAFLIAVFLELKTRVQ